MRLVVLNRFPFHESFAKRFCAAAQRSGHEVRYLGRDAIPGADFQHIRVERTRWRGPFPPARAWVLDAFDRRKWNVADSDLVIDLHAGATLWVLPGGGHVRVVHRIDPFIGDAIAARVRRTRLRESARRGDRFVAHTSIAYEALADLVGPGLVTHLPLPGPDPSPRETRMKRSGREILFVGDPRPEKGFDLLIEAVTDLGFTVRCVGGRRSAADQIDDAALAEAYARCDLVACPYRDEYGESGSASLVISEAIAYAAPVLTTPAMASSFPHGYGGVLVASAASAAALRAALASADLDHLQRSAQAEAPLIAEQRTSDRYLKGLLAFTASL